MDNDSEEIIKYFGEWIFPQKTKRIVDKFGEKVFELIADGLIQTSRSRIGTNPTMMKKVSGYLELTDRGWEFYNLKQQTQ